MPPMSVGACWCYRCECGNCQTMPTARECVCCCEIDQICEKKQESWSGSEMTCIINHEGFESVRLNVWVLQAAYFAYRYNLMCWRGRSSTRVSKSVKLLWHWHCCSILVFCLSLEIQVCCIPPADRLVLWLACDEYESYSSKLCSDKN